MIPFDCLHETGLFPGPSTRVYRRLTVNGRRDMFYDSVTTDKVSMLLKETRIKLMEGVGAHESKRQST